MTGAASLRWVVAGQFAGALADNALLLIAVGTLAERHAAPWTAPALRIAFYLAFVLLSAHAAAIADAWPKKHVVAAVNALKVAGCALLLAGASPVLAYALVGIGAAAHAPARYGILSELSRPGELVAANAWLEGSTVLAMLLGTLWGSAMLRGLGVLPWLSSGPVFQGTVTLAATYAVAALCAWPVRGHAASNPRALRRPALLREFRHSLARLWRDPAARTSLAVTSVFWAVAAVLQFVVLRWSVERLGLTLSDAGLLQAAVACGMIAGAAAAGRWVREEQALAVLPAGGALGAALVLLACLDGLVATTALLFAAGLLSGLLVVPMNTVLQRRGRALMDPGQAIGAQKASENLACLVGLAVYGATVVLQAGLQPTVLVLGVLLAAAMGAAAAGGRRMRGTWGAARPGR